MKPVLFFPETFSARNRAFLQGDAVKVFFFVRGSRLIMLEECYFFLMASMRKMRMNIPLSYTMEFFGDLFSQHVLNEGISDGVVHFMVYRETDLQPMEKSAVSFYFEVEEVVDVLNIRGETEVDLIKEITVNSHFLSTIRVHAPENVYAGIYAKENDLDDVILLNHNKRIARSIYGNFLFLEGNIIKVPKQSEGAYISPLMENFVTFLHKNSLAEIQEAEMIAFESQKAEEILMISDEKGIFSVRQIRKKSFGNARFSEFVKKWKAGFG